MTKVKKEDSGDCEKGRSINGTTVEDKRIRRKKKRKKMRATKRLFSIIQTILSS